MLEDILQKHSKIEVHFSPKNTINSEETNTEIAFAVSGEAMATEGRIATPFVEAPLKDVATHIIQPVAIRFLLTYTVRLASTIIDVPTHFVQIVTPCIYVVFTSPCRIFPLCFRRQTITIRFFIYYDVLCIFVYIFIP